MRRAPLIVAVLLCLSPRALAVDTDEQQRRQRLDESIKRALEFLHKNQNRDGSWAGGPANNPAITSLCVMAFLSAGHVPGEGPHSETVKKGIEWVLTRQADNGLIGTAGPQEMYHHGIATLMLAKAAGMCDEKLGKEIRKTLEKAVEVILNAQRKNGPHRGGWRYTRVGVDADMSVTGWQIMALWAVKNLGCDVPAERIAEAVGYIKRCRDTRTGAYCYVPSGRLTVPCTGIAIFALEICARDQQQTPELLKAGSYILKEDQRPKWGSSNFFYSIYQCSQAMFQLGGNCWDDFRPSLHKELLTNQKADGSWLGADTSCSSYGPNYCSAMGVLALAVEFRYLPIYQREEGNAGN